jgi:hypothetical protein
LDAREINDAVHRANQLKDIAGLISTASAAPTMEQFNTVVNKLNDIIDKLTVV